MTLICAHLVRHGEDLVSTLSVLSTADTTILLSYEDRYSPEKLEAKAVFFELMKEEHFVVAEIAREEQHPQFAAEDIHVVRFRKS
jgi:hypothetical protein